MNQSAPFNLPLGYSQKNDRISFRLFAPEAHSVEAVIYHHYEDEDGIRIPLQKNDEGIWEGTADGEFYGKWYAYLLQHPDNWENPLAKYPVADPWSLFVTTTNHYLQFPKTKIIQPEVFDWEGDNFVIPADPRDLVIYEAHIKDLVAHPSAKTKANGIYNDVREAEVGGIAHLKRLGINAVEFLPLQKFAYFEPPFGEETESGIKNTWNPYSRNYWGYMTSFFFAPETLYASNSPLDENAVIGRQKNAINEFKQVVKALHKANIAVLMDVVYNHASHYDLNPLKLTAKKHYFSLDEHGHFRNNSWTGNDIKTSSYWSRRLIVESVKYWMKEFHIDGFRFDLAGLIDWETVDEIRTEAQKINPNVLLIAEPWGGEYCPDKYSARGWSAWNDRLRNAFKGYNPTHDKGYIFGNWKPEYNRFAIENFIRGTLISGEQGLFQDSRHSVNYLESHDGYTLGDYIRIALDPAKATWHFPDKEPLTCLNQQELAITKFAALALFVSQGIIMIHAGQEWARSKHIAYSQAPDSNAGKLDHDSYNKDNQTNWLNFFEIDTNRSLFEYYKGLIKLRLSSPALRKANAGDIHFKVYTDPLHVTFSINGKSSGDKYDYFVSLNAHTKQSFEIKLPAGYWEMVVNKEKAGSHTFKSVKDSLLIRPTTGIVLRQLRVSKA